MFISKVISGGQTGADQGSLRAARAAGIPTGGWAPRGWLTEDGPAPWLADFGLVEAPESDYPARTRRNVKEAGALLWFGNPYSPGGKLTISLAQGRGIKQFVVIRDSTPADVVSWLREYVGLGIVRKTVTLLVAGNRESKSPGIGARVETFLGEVFALLREAVA